MIDETDRQTQIAWSAIGGVFQTKDFIVFIAEVFFTTCHMSMSATKRRSKHCWNGVKFGKLQHKATRPRRLSFESSKLQAPSSKLKSKKGPVQRPGQSGSFAGRERRLASLAAFTTG
jgi:hypothetical protein